MASEDNTPTRSIALAGFDSLTRVEQANIANIINRTYDKLATQTTLSLKIHAKTYHDTGNKHKTSITIEAVVEDGKHFTATADEWEVLKALHAALDKLEWQVRKHIETHSN